MRPIATNTVTKSDLTERLADRLGLSTRKAEEAVEAFTSIITDQLTREQSKKVTIRGFGTFDISHRSARKGVDPRDPSEEITISARTVPTFRAGKTLKRVIRRAHSDDEH